MALISWKKNIIETLWSYDNWASREAKIFDDTLVILGSGMSDGSRHSNKDLPVLLAGGGLKHQGHVISPQEHHKRVPLSNLWLSTLQWFGVERESRAEVERISGLELFFAVIQLLFWSVVIIDLCFFV